MLFWGVLVMVCDCCLVVVVLLCWGFCLFGFFGCGWCFLGLLVVLSLFFCVVLVVWYIVGVLFAVWRFCEVYDWEGYACVGVCLALWLVCGAEICVVLLGVLAFC